MCSLTITEVASGFVKLKCIKFFHTVMDFFTRYFIDNESTKKEVALLTCFMLLFINLNAQIKVAKTPPMGWNSYDCFGASVTEEEVKANADMMAAHLKDYGWEYIVIDYCWFYPYSGAMGNPPQNEDFKPPLTMDQYSRLYPAVDKFPSSTDGKGFKPLADYVHSLGLKFGIHLMRGIPRQAVQSDAPVKGVEGITASMIADKSSICTWLNSMYGVDMTKKGAQEYYNSLFELYASWGVDFVKVDNINAGQGDAPYRKEEAEAYRKAIDYCGRPMVLSFSSGLSYANAEHLQKTGNMWRISDDFWDDWNALKKQFERCNLWSLYLGAGHWPDADMIPIGRLNRRGPNNGLERETHFTRTEQKTLMTLWCIFRSPLMIGGDLTLLTRGMKTLFSNKEVLEVNQNSLNNHQLSRIEQKIIWVADIPGTSNKYVAFFNLADENSSLEVKLKDIGFDDPCQIRDLWQDKDLGSFTSTFQQNIVPHGSGLYKVSVIK